MKLRLKAIAIGLALCCVTSTVAHAMSELASISVTPLWPTNSNPGNVVLYEVAIERAGQGLLLVELSSSGLPDGCEVLFDSDPLRFVGRDPHYVYFLMVVIGNQPPPTDSYPFTVVGSAQRESLTFTNVVSPLPDAGPAALSLVSLTVLGNGDVELRGLGSTGGTYNIESTTDLTNPDWASVGSCTADGNGRFLFVHTGADAKVSSLRFYRAEKVEPVNP